MQHLLRNCIDNFGSAPRAFGLWDRLTYMRIPTPSWLRSDPADGLTTLFRNFGPLFSNGVVVWGHIVQANNLLFEAGSANCGGEVVYSLDDRDEIEPEDLRHIASVLFRLKGTSPDDPELFSIAEYLTDEWIRVFGLPVPRSISRSFRCKISTTFFVRKHLPARRLCTSLLPIIVNPHQPHVAMPLPERYWPEELIDWWTQ